MDYLERFVQQSNAIEGIYSEPSLLELEVYQDFLNLPSIAIGDLCGLVKIIQPDAKLRHTPGLNVRVGNHTPPPGGQSILYWLNEILAKLDEYTPYAIHQEYESLHPFTDGNGRSGRALWLWQIKKLTGEYPYYDFLHQYYYQSLDHNRK
jgi:hypothetical protein